MINIDGYNQVLENIAIAAQKANKGSDEIKLVAVSKTCSIDDILSLSNLGQNTFGESYVQEFISKHEEDSKINWHYIGQLQSNKVKYIVNKISMLHTLDRMSLASELSKRYKRIDEKIDTLIQVNIGDEPQKGGVPYDSTEEFLDNVCTLEGINIKGLMCIHPYDEPEKCRKYFTKMKELFDKLKSKGYPMCELSMGMSGDYQQAIEEGATIVRVGSAIFGSRKYT